MMRIGKVDFLHKPGSWAEFKRKNEKNKALKYELSRVGHTLETAYEKLTGKKPDVREVQSKVKKDKD